MGAVRIDLSIDDAKCIRCFACVKYCPRHARKISTKITPLLKVAFGISNGKQKDNYTAIGIQSGASGG